MFDNILEKLSQTKDTKFLINLKYNCFDDFYLAEDSYRKKILFFKLSKNYKLLAIIDV